MPFIGLDFLISLRKDCFDYAMPTIYFFSLDFIIVLFCFALEIVPKPPLDHYVLLIFLPEFWLSCLGVIDGIMLCEWSLYGK